MKGRIEGFGVTGMDFICLSKTPETEVDGTLRMSASLRRRCRQLKIALALGIGGAIAFSGTPTLAQITPDATLGTESSVVTPNVDVKGFPADWIEGGATRGANLFHSFSDFNVGEGLRVYFANPAGIENILSRVTGSNLSNILGTLGVDGEANLFLLNPNGIIFGENAQLDIAGSFVASTANSLVLTNGIEFSATNPEAPPLLTINIIPGLQYGSNHTGSITNAGTLEVGEGQNLSLEGDRIAITGQLSAAGGQISLAGRVVENRGQITTDGAEGGIVRIQTNNLLDTGEISANGTSGRGGEISVNYTGRVIQTASALTSVNGSTAGGAIAFSGGADTMLTTSGTFQATGEVGGTVHLFGQDLRLLAAKVDASGNSGGGEILVGGDYQGQTQGAMNAQNTFVNPASTLTADAVTTGNGGRVIVWSDQLTEFYGSVTAKGGELSGNGGLMEVSGKNELVFAGMADASATNGEAGQLLLDPKNITIDTSTTETSFQLLDPNPTEGNQFGYQTLVLTNGNIVVSSQYDDLIAADAGAVYLFNPDTGALLGTLNGAVDGDFFGFGAITALSNGNYVFGNDYADIGGIVDSGTVILANGTTGAEINRISGTVAGDFFGSEAITALSNGNYVFGSPSADISGIQDAGTVILANGTTGVEINRISGAVNNDYFGIGAITALSNGNYVLGNPYADIGGIQDAGTVILANGTTGAEINRISGASTGDSFGVGALPLDVSDTNSDIGSITALSNGNYVFGNPYANIGGIGDAGTVILANGTTGAEINRISGTFSEDRFGFGGITALTNGNYVFGSPDANIGGIRDAGTVILANGTTGAEINRISGDSADDRFGFFSGMTALSNGNYVFGNPYADIGGIQDAGTVILANGTTGAEINRISGTVTADEFGFRDITALSNGNYVFGNEFADIGGIQDVGTVILANGTTGAEINRISGALTGDFFGNGDITALSNGNYVFGNPDADMGGGIQDRDQGTVILANGTTGAEINRISGSLPFDYFGSNITALSNGNYLAAYPSYVNSSAGRVDIGIANPSTLTYSYFPDRNITITPQIITQVTNTGTAVTLQANNDITVNQAITTDNPTGNGGALTLEAGRSILLNADITTDSGDLFLFANQPLAAGVVDAFRDPGVAVITMAPGTTINAGTGNVNITLDSGTGLTNNTSGDITLNNINTSGNLTVTSNGAILGNGFLTIRGNASFTSHLANAGNVSVTNTNNTLLGNSIIGGDFTLNSGGTVSKVPGGLLRVAGNFTVNNAPGNPTLLDDTNIAPRQVLPNGDVIITQVGTINLSTDTVTGNLSVNSLAVSPGQFTAVFNGSSAITLNQPGNFFGGALSLNTTYASVNDVTGTPGITQSGAQIVSGTATFNADNGNISLTEPANQFGNLAFTGNDVAINESDGTNLLTSSATGDLSLTSGGAITQIPGNYLNITGDASFTSTLANAGNVTINNTSTTVLGNSLIGGDFTLNSGGSISQAPQATLKVAGAISVNAPGSVTLSNSGNVLPPLTLPNGDVIITQVGTINLPANSVTGNLTVNSLATGEQFTGIFNSSSAIDLNQSANSFGGTLSLNTTSAPLISVTATPGIIQSGAQTVGGTVTFNSAGDITTQDITAAAISLTSTGGSIDTTGGNIITSLSDAGASRDVSMQATGDIRLGNIDASGQTGGNISLTSNGTISTSGTTIRSDSFGTGSGGAINVTAASVSLTDGARLTAGTSGSGRGGDVTVNASESVELAGILADGFGGLLTETTGSGSSGDLIVNTERLIVRDGATVSASTRSSGQGGDVTINAIESVDVIGTGTRPNGQVVPSSLATATFGSGDAGILTINTRRFTARDGGVAAASTFGEGDGGRLIVNASDLVELLGVSADGSIPSGLSTDTFSIGDAGDLIVNTNRLIAQGGGAATASTVGEGDGGTLTVNASELVELIGTIPDGFASGLYAQAFGSGDAGDLNIATDILRVIDLARASVAAGNATDARVPTGQLIFADEITFPTNLAATGDAGNLNVEANQIVLDNGKLLASTDSGEGGNITLDVEDTISMRRNSEITATARGIGNGGNITIDAKFLIAQEDSDITANAFDGRGGNIRLTAKGVFLSPDSQITASSERGVDGTVEINTSVDPSRGLTQLPSDLVNAASLVDRSCTPGEGSLRNSSFTVTGRGGLPPSPNEPLNEEGLLEDLGSPVAARDEEHGERATAPVASSSSPLVQIVEAQGWVNNPDGTVILVAEAPTATPQSPRLNPASCESVSNLTETLTASPR